MDWENAIPVSLSLPLREDPYRGAPVSAVFENLLPDSEALRRRVAERDGAAGADAYSLLAGIGRDCVGALQFLADEADEHVAAIEGDPIDEAATEKLLRSLGQAPLGLSRDDNSVSPLPVLRRRPRCSGTAGAGASRPAQHHHPYRQNSDRRTAQQHRFVERCRERILLLEAAQGFGLPVSDAAIKTFGKSTALVTERFDRRWTRNGRLLRVPQEDCCQPLSVPPGRKYQSDGGQGLVQLLDLLKGSYTPEEDRRTVLKAQTLFWLMGAIDGHAKNFSVFLGPGGTYRLTPLYDILFAQPSLDTRQIERKQMKLARAVGAKNHHRVDGIQPRHFFERARAAGLSKATVQALIDEIRAITGDVIARLADELPPPRFPKSIHASVSKAVTARLRILSAGARGPMSDVGWLLGGILGSVLSENQQPNLRRGAAARVKRYTDGHSLSG